LPNFIKKEHPKKGKKKTRGKIQVHATKQPKRGRPHGGNGTTKNISAPNCKQLLNVKIE
jgi:hypothetical protein